MMYELHTRVNSLFETVGIMGETVGMLMEREEVDGLSKSESSSRESETSDSDTRQRKKSTSKRGVQKCKMKSRGD